MVERLRRALHGEADAIRPGRAKRVTRRVLIRRNPAATVVAALAAAALVAAAVAVAGAVHHPSQVQVGAGGTGATPAGQAPPARRQSRGGGATTKPTPPAVSRAPAPQVGRRVATPTTLPADRTSSYPPAQPPASRPEPTTTPPASLTPTGFDPLSVTFVSATDGWVLGTATCKRGACLELAHTTDRGGSWSFLPGPALSGSLQDLQSYGLQVRFADPDDGWVFGNLSTTFGGNQTASLWATHDGGATWARVKLPLGLSRASDLQDLETADGVAVAVVMVSEPTLKIEIDTAQVGSDTWSVSPTNLQVGAGPVPAAELVLQHSAGWVVEDDRSVVAGARSAGGAWRTWSPPCTGLHGDAQLAASTATDLTAVCQEGVYSPVTDPATGAPGTFERLWTSTDGGTSFVAGPVIPTADDVGIIASATTESKWTDGKYVATHTTVVGVAMADPGELIGSFDGGATWHVVADLPGATFTQVGFENPFQGVAIASAGGRNTLLMTPDGGKSWYPVPFGP